MLPPNVEHVASRAKLLSSTRRFFDERGFLEVQPPCLSRDCVVDAYLDPVTVDADQFGLADQTLPSRFFLQTSPEAAMKRMLAAGAPSIYSLGPVFRSGELSQLHNIEFTMLEWYEVGGNAASAIKLLGDYVSESLGDDGFDQITYRETFKTHAGLDPIDAATSALAQLTADIDAQLAATISGDRDAMLDVILSQVVAPKLGFDRPLIVTDYPLSQAALAKQSESDPECAARFELFARGIEIANGYDELLDADELLVRARANNQRRAACGRDRLPEQSQLHQAMQRGLPDCSGVAVGFDRLLLLTCGAADLSHVMSFTIRNA